MDNVGRGLRFSLTYDLTIVDGFASERITSAGLCGVSAEGRRGPTTDPNADVDSSGRTHLMSAPLSTQLKVRPLLSANLDV